MKKGIAIIISIVLIGLLSILALGVLWSFAERTIKKSSEIANLQEECLFTKIEPLSCKSLFSTCTPPNPCQLPRYHFSSRIISGSSHMDRIIFIAQKESAFVKREIESPLDIGEEYSNNFYIREGEPTSLNGFSMKAGIVLSNNLTEIVCWNEKNISCVDTS